MAKGARPKAGYSKCTKPDPEWIEEANLSILGSCKRKKRGKAKPKPSKKPVPAEEVSKKQKACKVVEVPVYDEENSPSSESSSSSQSAKSMTTKLAKFAAKQKAGQPWEVLFLHLIFVMPVLDGKSCSPASTESNAANAKSGDAEAGLEIS